jgi:hypothetical protein
MSLKLIVLTAGARQTEERVLSIVNINKDEIMAFAHKVKSYYVEIICQLDATDEFFIADLIACSTCFGHHYAHNQELESIIQVVAACRIWCLVFKLSV